MGTSLPPMGAADTHPWGRCPNCASELEKHPPANEWNYTCGAGYRWDDAEQRWVPNSWCPKTVQ